MWPPVALTGNFTYVAPRLPVKIVFGSQSFPRYQSPIVPGMSAATPVAVK
jgi:multidrug resistance efflux pump